MSRSNGNLAILDENRVSVVSACHSPFSAPRHFRCCALDFPQQSGVKMYDGHGGRDGEVTKVRKDVRSSTGGSQTGTQRSYGFRKHCLQPASYGYSEN